MALDYSNQIILKEDVEFQKRVYQAVISHAKDMLYSPYFNDTYSSQLTGKNKITIDTAKAILENPDAFHVRFIEQIVSDPVFEGKINSAAVSDSDINAAVHYAFQNIAGLTIYDRDN